MLDTILVVLVSYGLIRFLRGFGLIVGIGLIVFWLVRIKNTVALFYDKRKIRATLFLGVPGLIFLVLGLYFRFTWTPTYEDYLSDYPDSISSLEERDYTPTLAYLHIANHSKKAGKLTVGDQTEEIPAGDWKKVIVKSSHDRDTLRAWLDDSLVIDTIIGKGSYIGNFSNDVTVVAEEVIYTSSTYGSSYNTDDLGYEMLTKPGIERFSASLVYDAYGFDREAPATMSMYRGTTSIRKWDLSLLSSDELMSKILEALKESSASDEED